MKKLCLVIITVLAFASLAVAQSVSTADLKAVLIDSIKDYLSSQTPKLEKAELKDLIVVYLSTKGDAADLSSRGYFSGEKLIDIYNKAKGYSVTCTSKTCSQLGKQCGSWNNGCGSNINCGSCSSGICGSEGQCVQGQVLVWNVNHVVIQFQPDETKTFIARVPQNARAFFIEFLPMGPAVDYTFKMPLKPDGTHYKIAPNVYSNPNIPDYKVIEDNSGTLFTDNGYGFRLGGGENAGVFRFFLPGQIILEPIHPGDFILTVTVENAGWGYMATSVYY